MAGIIGCLLVFTTTSLLSNQVVTSSCLPKIITCGCGNNTVDVHIKRCLKISSWGPVCKPCKRYRRSQLCAKYQHCFQCVDGGCLKCEKGWYGIFCEKECRCENGGSCDRYGNCRCLPRYTGENCQTKLVKDCGSPNIPVHGKVNVSNTTEGSVASFECPPNFLLVGPANQTCLDTGQWSNKVPVCEYSCQVPKVSSLVVVRLESVKTRFRDYANDIELIREARFSCEEDYAIQGRQVLYCLPDGTWDSDPPTCVRKCKPPPLIRDGEVIKSEGGHTIQYRCHDNFKMENPAILKCLDGLWDSAPPRCVPKIQCDELFVENGHVKYSNNDRMVGSQATLTCDPYYIDHDADDMICGNDGFWEGGEFECVAEEDVMMCDDHEGPENGFVDHYSANHYEYYCYEGYFVSGETNNYCVDGQWVHEVPKCVQRITCKALDKPDGCSACYGEDCSKRGHKSIDCPVPTGDVVLPDDHFLVGTVIEFRYDRTLYHLSGARRRVCQSDGVWSGRQTTCKPICGQQFTETRRTGLLPRIRMGNSTKEGEWPWQVALIRIHESKVLCGGSLISHDMVLTAAHCVVRSGKRIEAGEIGIHVGSVNLKGKNHKLVEVKDIIVHNSYDHRKYDNDIALIQLREKLQLSTNILPVCLPDPKDDEETVINDSNPIQPVEPSTRNLTGVQGVVIGWGQTENGSYPDILKMTKVTIVDQNICFNYSEELNTPVKSVTDNMFCAVGPKPNLSDACSGDSGGPFLVEDEPGIWTVVGIVGFGPPCSIPVEERYGFYTRVDKFLSWIHQNF